MSTDPELRFPPLDRRIVEALARLYPNKLPDNPEKADISRLVGRQDVIRFLEGELEAQEEEAMENAHVLQHKQT